MSLINLFAGGANSYTESSVLSLIKQNPGKAQEVEQATGCTALHYACCGAASTKVIAALVASYPEATKMADSDGERKRVPSSP